MSKGVTFPPPSEKLLKIVESYLGNHSDHGERDGRACCDTLLGQRDVDQMMVELRDLLIAVVMDVLAYCADDEAEIDGEPLATAERKWRRRLKS